MISRDDLLNAISSIRTGSKSMMYAVALSMVELIEGETEYQIDGKEYGNLGIGFNIHTKSYEMIIPPAIPLDVNPLYAIKHELEHLLRLHIVRGAMLIRKSRIANVLGRRVAAMATNIIADAYINEDLSISSDKIIRYDNMLPRLAGLLGDPNLVKKVKSVIPSVYNSSLEDVFNAVDMLVEFPERTGKGGKKVGGSGQSGLDDDLIESILKRAEQADKGGLPEDSNIIDDVEKTIAEITKSAGSMPGRLGAFLERLNQERYSIERFMQMIYEFNITTSYRFTKRKPPRDPNRTHGIVYFNEAPRVAILVDSSGSVPHDIYVEFFKIAKTIEEKEGSDILFVIFDSDVAYADNKVPTKIEKTDGGTRFMPALDKAIDEGYDKIVMLTDMANYDTVTADVYKKAQVFYVMTSKDDYRYLRSEVKPRSVWWVDPAAKSVVRYKEN